MLLWVYDRRRGFAFLVYWQKMVGGGDDDGKQRGESIGLCLDNDVQKSIHTEVGQPGGLATSEMDQQGPSAK